MNIKLYPSFNDVFNSKELYGLFYPLCSVGSIEEFGDKTLHFVSSNGTWMNEAHETELNTTGYTLFDYIDGKYSFKGDIKLYQGYQYAKELFPLLEGDFQLNGADYLKKRTQTDEYTEQVKNILPAINDNNFDIDYYTQTFYEFSINKLHYELTGEFAAFRRIINGWGKSESPVVYALHSEETQGALNHMDIPEIKNFSNFEPVGQIIGSDFFTDGNDSILFFDPQEMKVISVNFYS